MDRHPTDTSESPDLATVIVASQHRLVPLIARIVDDDAEDVVQEALVRLADHEVSQRPAVEISAWLRRVSINLAFNRRRDVARWRDRSRRGGAGVGADVEDPAEASIRTEEREQVRQTLDALGPVQRAILLLRYSGYSYAEIAATLERPVSSIGTTLARAERAFRLAYEEMYP